MSGDAGAYQDYDGGYGYPPGFPPSNDDPPLDLESAVVERLADWLAGLAMQHTRDGTVFSFAHVYREWPDAEDELSAYPVACVTPMPDTELEVYSGTPDPHLEWAPGGGPYALFAVGTARVSLQLDVWCGDRSQRRDVARYLSNERAPDEGTGSLILELGRYWNAQARYNWLRQRRWDSAETARAGSFRQTWYLECVAPEIRADRRPQMDARIASLVVGTDVDLTL